MRPSHDVDSPNPVELRDKALNLRESVNSSLARMSAQAERLEKLRREIAALRALVDKPLPAPAPVRSNPPLRSAPIVKEAAAVSAAATASFKTDARDNSWKPVPYIAIFFVAVGIQMHVSRTKAPAPIDAVAVAVAPAVAVAASPEPILDDGGADEALLLAHDWRLPGDERPLAERLGSDTNPPGSRPEWTAERTGESTYRVSFRPSGADAGYDFDVDLTARSVDPTPETAALISPRLASRR